MFGFGSRTPVKTLSPAEARDLALKGAALLVDVRESGEWASSRIAGAVHAPMSRLRELAPLLPQDRQIIFYCHSGARSAQAISICQALGLPHDVHMGGGVIGWRAQGFPLTR